MKTSSNYNTQNNSFYNKFENASGLITNEIAYTITGKLGFSKVRNYFSARLRVCDVGCFLGGTTMRWLQLGKSFGELQILGTDIHQTNIDYASKNFQELSFCFMESGSSIPLIQSEAYHLIFATFVLDTISSFQDVEILCQNMVNALEKQGFIFLLRLHPNALKSSQRFKEYAFNHNPNWQHGDKLEISLIRDDGEKTTIHDVFWESEKIANVFEVLNCEVKLIPLSSRESQVSTILAEELLQAKLSENLPEWNEPLYQIIQIQKR